MKNLRKGFITPGNCFSQICAVDVKVAEQPLEIVFAFMPGRRLFNIPKGTLQGFIQIFIHGGIAIHVLEKFAGQNEETLGVHHFFPYALRFGVGEHDVVETFVSGFPLSPIDVAGEVFRNVAIEEHAENILFKLPAGNFSTQFVGNVPDDAVQFRPFQFLFVVGHRLSRKCSRKVMRKHCSIE